MQGFARSRSWIVLALSLAALAGCNAIAGIHSGDLAPGDAGQGDDATASGSGAGQEGGSPDGTAPSDAATDGKPSTSDGGACTPASLRCNGLQPQSCNPQGQWQNVGSQCPYVCTDGACVGSCSPSSKQCNGLVPQTCDAAGTWQNGTACQYVCSAGACTGVCSPGSQQCSGSTPQTCDSSGTWQNGTPCTSVCSNGACTGSCTPGTQQCSGSTPQSCDASGTWQNGTPCAYGCTNGTCNSCLSVVPSGWTVAEYSTGSTACPSGYTSHAGQGAPSVTAGACTCACTTTMPGCTQGQLALTYGSTGCYLGPQGGFVNGGCDAWNLAGYYADPTPLPPYGGSCSSTVSSDPTKVTAPATLYCDVPTSGAESVCGGAADTGFASCITASGAVACPSGTPFQTQYVVEDSVSLSCSTCTTCAYAPTCDNPTISVYSDTGCNTRMTTIPLNGSCSPVGNGGVALIYSATPNATCTPGTSAGSTSLVNPRTVCCR